MSQLDLFGPPPAAETPRAKADDEAAAALAAVHAEAARLAAGIPDTVRFGTSSWSFPGWRGLVYPAAMGQTALAREGLREYARHPLLRTVGIDRSYYAPVPEEDLRRYASQVGPGFLACAKAPARVTAAVLHGGGRRGAPNPDYMDPDVLVDELIAPFDRAFRAHTGPFVLEFPPAPRGTGPDASEFVERLDGLLGALPRQFTYAVELRDVSLLTPSYRAALARHGAGHVYNYWSAMPMPLAQAEIVPADEPPVAVARLLLAPGTFYEDQREAFRPFNRLVAPDTVMRGQVVEIVRRRIRVNKPTFVLVNNKAEGSSPLTVMALAALLAARVTP